MQSKFQPKSFPISHTVCTLGAVFENHFQAVEHLTAIKNSQETHMHTEQLQNKEQASKKPHLNTD